MTDLELSAWLEENELRVLEHSDGSLLLVDDEDDVLAATRDTGQRTADEHRLRDQAMAARRLGREYMLEYHTTDDGPIWKPGVLRVIDPESDVAVYATTDVGWLEAIRDVYRWAYLTRLAEAADAPLLAYGGEA